MAKLTSSVVKHVAKLAQLKLKPSEVEKFKKQLSEVISYIDELNEVNTSKTEPTSQTTGLTNVTRKDSRKTNEGLTQEEAVSGTDKSFNGYFKVPMILTERSDK
jgi:aspartyl-tRNA(Asn)/glutamyl-tRNA(Gln) amidotransferase subunit C